MNTQTLTPTLKLKKMAISSIFVFSLLFFVSAKAQTPSNYSLEGTVKGKVMTSEGPLLGANVLLKGTNTGTTTDKNGEFTFPKPLDINDILIISYLSYDTKEIRITDPSKYLTVTLTDDLIEIMGAPASNQPYKSKRRH